MLSGLPVLVGNPASIASTILTGKYNMMTVTNDTILAAGYNFVH